MSGGSFNYLCYADDVGERRSDVLEMQSFLQVYGFVQAADDTGLLLDLLDQVDELAKRLREVWHDMEWFISGDYGLEQVQAEHDRYVVARGESGEKPPPDR